MIHHYSFDYPNRSAFIADGWDYLAKTAGGLQRNTEQLSGNTVTYSTAGMRIPADVGGLWAGSNSTRNTVFRDLADSWKSVQVHFDFNPQADDDNFGIALYEDDDNYRFIMRVRASYQLGQQVSITRETAGSAASQSPVAVSATTGMYLRIEWQDGPGQLVFYWSPDGLVWNFVDTMLGYHPANLRLALIVGAATFTSREVTIHDVWVEDDEGGSGEPTYESVHFLLTSEGWQPREAIRL